MLPAASHAQGAINAAFGWMETALLLVVGEVLIPDLQYEWGPGTADAHTTLVWPLSISAEPMALGRRVAIGLDARVELHVRPSDGFHPSDGTRGVAAARLPVFIRTGRRAGKDISLDQPYPGLYAEVGAVRGRAGSGSLAGGGVLFGNHAWALAVGYRALELDGIGRRHTVGLDVHLSYPVMGILR